MRGKTGADREISVNTYTGGFTTMLNHHLRNRNLSLKAVGLLSKMLSLPPDWDYSIRGLAMLNTDGIDGIRTAMKELEDEGYVALSSAAMLMVVIMLPFIFFALYEKDGQPAEKILGHVVKSMFLRDKVRPYRTNNLYSAIQRQIKEQEELQIGKQIPKGK